MKTALPATVFYLVSAFASMASPALTIVGSGSDGERVEIAYELDDLRAMTSTSFTTANPYVEHATTFRGPLLRDLVGSLSTNDDTVLRLRAANDYSVAVPLSDALEYPVIVAFEADGKEMSLRDKGPLWVMYPISEHAELDDPLYHSRLIWQLVAIEAE